MQRNILQQFSLALFRLFYHCAYMQNILTLTTAVVAVNNWTTVYADVYSLIYESPLSNYEKSTHYDYRQNIVAIDQRKT